MEFSEFEAKILEFHNSKWEGRVFYMDIYHNNNLWTFIAKEDGHNMYVFKESDMVANKNYWMSHIYDFYNGVTYYCEDRNIKFDEDWIYITISDLMHAQAGRFKQGEFKILNSDYKINQHTENKLNEFMRLIK